jgi:deazaflavin-dependent oxidoreductase (nitroreductase family)
MAKQYRLSARAGAPGSQRGGDTTGARRTPRNTVLLTTTGRKSGRPRTRPVTLVDLDGERWLVSSYGDVGWVHNVRALARVVLRRGKRAESFRAEPVDAARAGSVLKVYVRQVPVTAPYFDVKRSDPVDAFVAEADRHPVFRLVADAGSGAGGETGTGND